MKGWECPVCGKGLAPWVKECNCLGIKIPKETEHIQLPQDNNTYQPGLDWEPTTYTVTN